MLLLFMLFHLLVPHITAAQLLSVTRSGFIDKLKPEGRNKIFISSKIINLAVSM